MVVESMILYNRLSINTEGKHIVVVRIIVVTNYMEILS